MSELLHVMAQSMQTEDKGFVLNLLECVVKLTQSFGPCLQQAFLLKLHQF